MCMCGQGSSPLRQRGEALLLLQRSSASQGECTSRGKTVSLSNSSWTAGVMVHSRTCGESDILSWINILHPCFSHLFFLQTLDSPSPPPPLPLPHTPTFSLLPLPPLLSIHSDPAKLAEGLETPEFWSHLGGKTRHHHFTSTEVSPYICTAAGPSCTNPAQNDLLKVHVATCL